LLRGQGGGQGARQDHVDRTAHQLGSECRQSVVPTFGPAELDRDVLALDEAALLQSTTKRLDQMRGFRKGPCAHKADHWHSRCCPRAGSGHAAVPPSNVMNSRRFS